MGPGPTGTMDDDAVVVFSLCKDLSARWRRASITPIVAARRVRDQGHQPLSRARAAVSIICSVQYWLFVGCSSSLSSLVGHRSGAVLCARVRARGRLCVGVGWTRAMAYLSQ